MKLPKTIKVGRRRYVVLTPKYMARTAVVGRIWYDKGAIAVATHCNVTHAKRSDLERSDTFWHEITHGVLFDMGHPLESDEKFVTAFSKRLNRAIRSATF